MLMMIGRSFTRECGADDDKQEFHKLRSSKCGSDSL